ncbi:MAG: hypothetical protein EOO01_18010, partial [Chitinophagaceae bacterium]
MKLFILTIAAIFANLFSSEAQLLKKMKERAAQTAENKILNKTATATDKSMDKAEAEVKKDAKKKTDTPAENSSGETNEDTETTKTVAPSKSSPKGSSLKSFANYDFVPGDKLIYYYDMAGERDAEIPGRFLVNDGNVEVQTYKGEKVLLIPAKADLSMVPAMNGSNYLPEQFTLEFDVMTNGEDYKSGIVNLYFRKPQHVDYKWSGTSVYRIQLSGLSNGKGGIDFTTYKDDGTQYGGHRYFADEANLNAPDTWRRVAIYVNKNIGKVYVDQYRVGIMNQLQPGAGMVTFEFSNDYTPVMIKNIRIAKGGSDAYNKVLTEGKFVSYGIQFDVNRATLKPESMGTINEVYK